MAIAFIEAIPAIAGAITAGVSLVNSTLDAFKSTGREICCGIQVENWTKFALDDPDAYADGGEIPIPPGIVVPARREAMVVTNTNDKGGTFGTVSWLVNGMDIKRRVVVMWSLPSEKDKPNCLGIGITDAGHIDHKNEWFEQMDKGTEVVNLKTFKKLMYNRQIDTLEVQDDRIRVVGTMGSTKKSQAFITIRPVKFDRFR